MELTLSIFKTNSFSDSCKLPLADSSGSVKAFNQLTTSVFSKTLGLSYLLYIGVTRDYTKSLDPHNQCNGMSQGFWTLLKYPKRPTKYHASQLLRQCSALCAQILSRWRSRRTWCWGEWLVWAPRYIQWQTQISPDRRHRNHLLPQKLEDQQSG